ncbi:MAG: pilus assembly protein N-terminal domain-containing protein [Caulobacterales bacterium]|nr:pilus assembly protein N-terminal domain-containing protein [Caulobacterales bacterium]MCA0372129.1 pilus assembly protein N-terminal domain-containing protein [Pseudomonadota bacterium]
MRFKFISAAIALIASPALAHPLSINIDQSKPIILSRAATGVVVGNASIADVIVHDTKTIIVIGKSVGSTHILVLGEKGKTLYSGIVSVSPGASANLVTVQRGDELSTQLCTERCIDIASPEDGSKSLNEAVSKIRVRSSSAKGM